MKLGFKSCGHLYSSQIINKFTTLSGVKVILSCFKQILLNPTLFDLCYFCFGERLLFDVVGGLIFSFGNIFRLPPYDFF